MRPVEFLITEGNELMTSHSGLALGVSGTSMITIIKGKTEISRNLQKVLSPFFPYH